jgi:hypothetical protein
MTPALDDIGNYPPIRLWLVRSNALLWCGRSVDRANTTSSGDSMKCARVRWCSVKCLFAIKPIAFSLLPRVVA